MQKPDYNLTKAFELFEAAETTEEFFEMLEEHVREEIPQRLKGCRYIETAIALAPVAYLQRMQKKDLTELYCNTHDFYSASKK